MDSFHRRKLECQREEANEQDPYAVVIVKRTVGCGTKVCGILHVVCFFSEVKISNVE